MKEFFDALRELNELSIFLRLLMAVVLSGLIGIERGRKRRPAGFRTHMLVCLGATLTMLISQYLLQQGLATDVTRLSAQVISGIGFLGAGTIIVTGRQQVKGLTTAAGLWASACMGLAIGAGFYEGALFACVFIFLSNTLLNRFDNFIMSTSRNMIIYIELTQEGEIGTIVNIIKKQNIRIVDIEISKSKSADGKIVSGIIITLELRRKMPHTEVLTTLAGLEGVNSVEEL